MKSLQFFLMFCTLFRFIKMAHNVANTRDKYYIIEMNDEIRYKEVNDFRYNKLGIRAIFSKLAILTTKDYFCHLFNIYEAKFKKNDYMCEIECIIELFIAVFDKYLSKDNDLSNFFKNILTIKTEKAIFEAGEIYNRLNDFILMKLNIMNVFESNVLKKDAEMHYVKELHDHQELIISTINLFFCIVLSIEEQSILELYLEKFVFALDMLDNGLCDAQHVGKIYKTTEKISIDKLEGQINKNINECKKENIMPRYIMSIQYDIDTYSYFAMFFNSFLYVKKDHEASVEFAKFFDCLIRKHLEMESKLIFTLKKTNASCKLIHHNKLHIYVKRIGIERIDFAYYKQNRLTIREKCSNMIKNLLYGRNEISLYFLGEIFLTLLKGLHYIDPFIQEGQIFELKQALHKIQNRCEFKDQKIENYFVNKIYHLKDQVEIVYTQTRFLKILEKINFLLHDIDDVCSVKMINNKKIIKETYQKSSFFMRFYKHEIEKLDIIIENTIKKLIYEDALSQCKNTLPSVFEAFRRIEKEALKVNVYFAKLKKELNSSLNIQLIVYFCIKSLESDTCKDNNCAVNHLFEYNQDKVNPMIINIKAYLSPINTEKNEFTFMSFKYQTHKGNLLIIIDSLLESLFNSLFNCNQVEIKNQDMFNLISRKIHNILIICGNNNHDDDISFFCKCLEERFYALNLFDDSGNFNNFDTLDCSGLPLNNKTKHPMNCGYQPTLSFEELVESYSFSKSYRNVDINIFKIIYKIVFYITKKSEIPDEIVINEKMSLLKDKLLKKIIKLAKTISYEILRTDSINLNEELVFDLFFEILDIFIEYEVCILKSYSLKIKNSITQLPIFFVKSDNSKKSQSKDLNHRKYPKTTNSNKTKMLQMTSKLRYQKLLADDALYFTIFINIVNKIVFFLNVLKRTVLQIKTDRTMVDIKEIIGFEEEIEKFNFHTMEPSMITIFGSENN